MTTEVKNIHEFRRATGPDGNVAYYDLDDKCRRPHMISFLFDSSSTQNTIAGIIASRVKPGEIVKLIPENPRLSGRIGLILDAKTQQ